MKFIDSKNFDKSFDKILAKRQSRNVVKGRFDLEPVVLTHKVDFVIQLLLSFNLVEGVTYKILFWEQTNLIKDLIEYSRKKHQFAAVYEGSQLPGVVFIDEKVLDESFCKRLLVNHFNYEMAEDPSLNLRVYICVNHSHYITLLDIYDDRGLDIYYLDRAFT